MQKAETKKIKLVSEYSGFDLLLLKKPLQCTVRVPETILVDRFGAPKEWIFNSSKLAHHPVLKKRRENLLPLLIVKSICSKHVKQSSISQFKTIPELREYVSATLNDRKDAEFVTKKKSVEIRTANQQILQLTLLQFLEYISENKQTDQFFYDKWRMIQEKVNSSKVEECYTIESNRKNHIIESKSCKYIALPTGNKVTAEYGSTSDPFKETMSQEELMVTDTKNIESYKFFDTYLNKKFFTAVQEIIDCIEKNYKCVIESMITRFVIDSNRQPYLASISELFVKPVPKLYQFKGFAQGILQGQVKLEHYTKILQQLIAENPVKKEPNLHQPISEQRGYKCKGEFCDAALLTIPHLTDQKFKLPLINSLNSRKISANLIEAVKKRRSRVIQKLKESKAIDLSYVFEVDESSEYEDSDEEAPQNVKVCQTCFVFYLSVLKHFDLDAYNNLVEKKTASSRGKMISEDLERKGEEADNIKEEQRSMLALRKSQWKSLKTLRQRPILSDEPKEVTEKMKRSATQHARLHPVSQSPKVQKQGSDEKKQESSSKKVKQSLSLKKKEEPELSKNKLIDAKLVNAKLQLPVKENPVKTVSPIKTSKPINYLQAAEQLLQKLTALPNSSVEEFVKVSKAYYLNNLPQAVDRYSFSSEYLVHLYDFMNNSTLGTAPGNRIKKRPEMTLKRLSQLTSYPQIVSRSTFIFNTIICDEKTTIPFCVISSSMVHHNNIPGQPYQNVFILSDLFDSYIEYISMGKELLEDAQNTRIIMFNYPGQSHTIFDKNSQLRASEINSIIDKLIYRLSSEPNQLGIIGKTDSYKFIGFGYGGYLLASYISACPILHDSVKGVTLINTAYSMTQKYKSILQNLLQLYSVQDQTTEDNAFLFYNKAINSNIVSNDHLEEKAGLNSIKLQGRCYLLRNALEHWDELTHQNFGEYQGKVNLIYSKTNVLLSKSDMLKFSFMADADRTVMKSRLLLQIDGGHDVQSQNYEGLMKHLGEFLS